MTAEPTAPLVPEPPTPPLPRRSTGKIVATVAVIVPLAMVMISPMILLVLMTFGLGFSSTIALWSTGYAVLIWWQLRSLFLALWRDSWGALCWAGWPPGRSS